MYLHPLTALHAAELLGRERRKRADEERLARQSRTPVAGADIDSTARACRGRPAPRQGPSLAWRSEPGPGRTSGGGRRSPEPSDHQKADAGAVGSPVRSMREAAAVV